MHRYTKIFTCVFVLTGSVVAWVTAQDNATWRKPSWSRPATSSPPAHLDDFDTEQAVPIEQATQPMRSPQVTPAITGEILPVAGPADEDASLRTARRGFFRSTPVPSSSTGKPTTTSPRLMPANNSSPMAPIAPPANVPVETPAESEEELSIEIPDASADGVTSVLKKRPTPRPVEASVAPQTQTENPATNSVDKDSYTPSPSISSRRIGTSAKPNSIRSENVTPASPKTTQPTPPTLTPKSNTSGSNVETLRLQGNAPRVLIEATGPQAVTVGKSATYAVMANNASDAPASKVEVRVGIPPWVSLEGGEGTKGDARQEADPAGRQWLIWSIPELAPNSKEQLLMNVVVNQNQPFELAINWTQQAQSISTEVAVREPQVDIRIEGPSDMLFGEQKTFTLHIHNPGTGDAENVVVEVASGAGTPNRLPVGLLTAGERKQVPFAVMAHTPGDMEIKAIAQADGGLKSDAASRVLVRRATLEVAIGAPPMKFAGGEVTYEVAVANVGDAIAEGVSLNVVLPLGAKYVGGLEGAASAGDTLSLKLGNLAPNTEKVYDVRCILTMAGDNKFQANTQAKGDLTSAQVAITNVEALADLKLTVNEPTGPVPVGSDASYEIRLVNRGTKSAGNVQVVMQFAQGLEPLEVMGAKAQVADGQALFETLGEVGPGKELVLKVKSRVEQSGSHAFRVEVKAADPQTRLVSEGVTRCFADTAGAVRATARRPSATTQK